MFILDDFGDDELNRVVPDGSFEEVKSCPYCGSNNVYYENVGFHIKAFCGKCGSYIKFVKQWQNDQDWSKQIKERDMYTCKRCGRQLTSRQLHAHHKIPKWFMPALQYDLNNGICLCNSCHKQIHGKDGTIREEGDNDERV